MIYTLKFGELDVLCVLGVLGQLGQLGHATRDSVLGDEQPSFIS